MQNDAKQQRVKLCSPADQQFKRGPHRTKISPEVDDVCHEQK